MQRQRFLNAAAICRFKIKRKTTIIDNLVRSHPRAGSVLAAQKLPAIISGVTIDDETTVLGAFADSVQEVTDLDPDHKVVRLRHHGFSTSLHSAFQNPRALLTHLFFHPAAARASTTLEAIRNSGA